MVSLADVPVSSFFHTTADSCIRGHSMMLVMVALCNMADHYILSCGFYLSFFPRLISAVGDWMSIPYFHTWCGLSANLECMSEMYYTLLAENTGHKKSPFWHHHTNLSGYIFGTKACIDNRKNVKQQYFLHMSS